MKISLDYRNASPMHCDIAVFINGAQAGVIRLRQDEIVSFQQIIAKGCVPSLDTFRCTGKSLPPEDMGPM